MPGLARLTSFIWTFPFIWQRKQQKKNFLSKMPLFSLVHITFHECVVYSYLHIFHNKKQTKTYDGKVMFMKRVHLSSCGKFDRCFFFYFFLMLLYVLNLIQIFYSANSWMGVMIVIIKHFPFQHPLYDTHLGL